MGFPKSPSDIPMNCILHQESLGDHKTIFSRKQNYEKLDLESFELEHHWISSYARSKHQLNRPDLPNVSNLVSLENQVQVLKSLRIFFFGLVYLYTSRFYVQHTPRINQFRRPQDFMLKCTVTDVFLESLSYTKGGGINISVLRSLRHGCAKFDFPRYLKIYIFLIKPGKFHISL